MRQAIPTWLIISVVVLYAPLCFVQLGIFLKSIESKEEKKIIVKEIMLDPIEKKDSIPDSVESSSDSNSVYEVWSKAMYERFAKKWTELFANATYPAD